MCLVPVDTDRAQYEWMVRLRESSKRDHRSWHRFENLTLPPYLQNIVDVFSSVAYLDFIPRDAFMAA